MREGGGNCLKYLKKGWNRKEGRETKILKVGGKLGQEVGALKRGGSWKPLTNYTKNYRKWDYFFMTVVSMDINLLIIMVFPSRNIFHCNIEIKTQILVYPGSHRSTI